MKALLNILFLGALMPALASGENFSDFLNHHVNNSWQWHLPIGVIDFAPMRWYVGQVDMGMSLHIAMLFIGFFLCTTLILFSSKRVNTLPTNRFGHAIEAVVLFLRDDIVVPFLGKKYSRQWLPFILTLFFFLLTLNLIGLIPYMATATSNINFTAAMALISFLIFNIAGMLHNGPFHYVKNLAPKGTPIFVLIILYPIEIIGLFTKSIALCIRMFANLSAGHFVIFSLLGLIIVFKSYFVAAAAVPGALFIWMLEILVAFLQAYVFTLLTTLFIGSAIHQDH